MNPDLDVLKCRLHNGLFSLHPAPHEISDIIEHLKLFVRRNSIAEHPTPKSLMLVMRAAMLQYWLITDGFAKDLDKIDADILLAIDENHRTEWLTRILRMFTGQIRPLESRLPIALAMAKSVIDVMEV